MASLTEAPVLADVGVAFRVRGEVDTAGADQVRWSVFRHAVTNPGGVVLSFTELESIDSSGVAALLP